MDYIHNARITVFVKEDEDIDKIKQGLIKLSSLDLEKEKLKISEQTASGFSETKIKIFEIFIEKKRHTRLFMQNLMGLLSEEQKETLVKQVQSRLDEELYFFLRLDKAKWVEEHTASLTDSGNCYHIKMSIASYPKNRENTIKVIKEMLLG